MEKSLVIVGKNVGLVTALAFAVTNLLAPFTWEGVFVPLVPDNARELFGAPVPFILGTTSSPRGEDLSPSAAVLFVQETVTLYTEGGIGRGGGNAIGVQRTKIEYSAWFTRLPEVSADMPIPDHLERVVTSAASCFSSEARATREVAISPHTPPPSPSSSKSSTPAGFTRQTNNKSMRYNPRINTAYLSHMSKREKRSVQAVLEAITRNNLRFTGDIADPSAWRRYVRFNTITEEDEFIPHLFMEPMRSVVEFQDAVVQTQLFLGFVDKVRTEYNHLEPFR